MLEYKSPMTINTLIGIAILAFSSSAMAHFELGDYKGTAADGSSCSFTVKGVSFEDNLRHPLNERIEIVFIGITYKLAHLPVVDAVAGTVRFDHSHLRAIRGVATGGESFTVSMDEREDHEGPSSFVFLNDNYKVSTSSSKLSCEGLAHSN